MTPSQTAVMLADGSISRIGATIGTTTTAISMKSRKKPRRKITAMTMTNCAQKPPGRVGQEFLDQFFAAKRAEGRRQHRSAQQNDEDQRRGLRRLHHHAAQRVFDLVGSPAAPHERNQETRTTADGRQRNAEASWSVLMFLMLISKYSSANDNGDQRQQSPAPPAPAPFLPLASGGSRP